MREKVVLAYSGGVDTSVAIKWIQENYNMDVIALTVDVGNESDFTVIKQKALNAGAIKAIVKDVKNEFVEDYIFPALRANAMYQGVYPLATAIARPLIAKLLAQTAQEEEASAVAHGCTGKGNDQVRFEVGIRTFYPSVKILAPAREWEFKSREQSIAYAKRHNIPLPVVLEKPFSIDENLWGKAIECSILENPMNEAPEEAFTLTVSVDQAPAQAEYVTIDFEEGLPTAINSKKMKPLELINAISALAGKHGVGRIDHVEDRLVGIKSREVYESPVGVALIAAHKALEFLTLSRAQLSFNQTISNKYADIIYEGLWYSGLKKNLDAYLKDNQKYVTGSVRLKMHKGHCTAVGRISPYSLYNYDLATYDAADKFDHSQAEGFIQLFGMASQLQAQIQPEIKEK